MVRGKRYKVGQIFAIKLTDDKFTIGQLIHHQALAKGKSNETFAFFDYLFHSLEEIRAALPSLRYDNPIAIDTLTERPHELVGWTYLSREPVTIDPSFKKEITPYGLYKDWSVYPYLYLLPYFGIFPWDYAPASEYFIDSQLLPGVPRPKYIRFAKDFSTEELLSVLPLDNIRVIERLEEEAGKASSFKED